MDEGTVDDPTASSTSFALSAWSHRVLDSAMDAVIVIDAGGRVVYWNPAAEGMFGRSWDQVAGLEMADLIIPPQLRGRHRESFGHSDLGSPGSILGRRMEVVGQRADGSQFPVELTITRTDEGPTRLFTGYLRDITERQQLMEELRASRTRLLEVSDRTRREIERDLHDGAQQQLVGAAIIVAEARTSLSDDPIIAAGLLDRAGEVLRDAITEIRELARGVLPRVLNDHGLAPALAELGRRSPIPVHVDATAERWAPIVETTVYFIAAEGLTNAARYGAQTVRLHVRAQPALLGPAARDRDVGARELVCSVGDDGPGGADPSRGTGLRGLQDRVTAVGGTVEIVSPVGQGTTVTGRIPILQRDDR